MAEYWRLQDVECEPKRAHRREEYCYDFVPCDPPHACLAENTCAEGYTGLRCATCCDVSHQKLEGGADNPECVHLGDYYYRHGGECEPCPGDTTITWALMATAALCFAAFAYQLRKKNVSIAILSIGVDYFQVLSIFADTKADWPASIELVYDYMSFFSFNLNVAKPECTISLTYEEKWFFVETVPLFMLATVGGFSLMSAFYMRFVKNKHGFRKVWKFAPMALGMALLLFYYMYLYVSSMSLDVFNCDEIVSMDGESVSDGFQYLRSEPSLRCNTGNTIGFGYGPLAPYAIATTIGYSVGFPCLLAWIFFADRNHAKIHIDQLLRAQLTGASYDTNPHFAFRKAFGDLYYRYRPEHWYWMVVIVARKLAIVLTALLFRKNATIQMCMILLVMFLAYAAQVRCSPYMSEHERLQVLERFAAEIETIDKAVLEMNPNAEKDRTFALRETAHPDAAHQAEVERQASQGAVWEGSDWQAHRRKPLYVFRDEYRRGHIGERELIHAHAKHSVNYLFNYNTVESVLLACAVLICNFGIIFESEYMQGKKARYQREFLATVTLCVVFGSLFYYFVVCWSEIIGAMYPPLRCNCLSVKTYDDVVDDGDELEIDESGFEMTHNRLHDDAEARRRAEEAQADQSFLTYQQQQELKRTLALLRKENAALDRKIEGAKAGAGPAGAPASPPRRAPRAGQHEAMVATGEIEGKTELI